MPSHCFIIAEIAQAHDGSLGTAHAYIDAAAAAGADAIKFQTHIAAAESTPAEPWRVKFSLQDATRYAYWERMQFTPEQWAGLKQHAVERGLQFLSSPFSVEAADLLQRVGVSAWKLASGEYNNLPLLERILSTGLPIFVSTGMSTLEEIDRFVARIREAHVEFTVMQCTSAYPCGPEEIGLNLIPFFRERYQCAVGLSDHSGTIYPGLAGAAIGLDALEVHVTFSRECFGPDVPASVTTAELRELVKGIRYIEKMRDCPVIKDSMAGKLGTMRQLFTRSIVASTDIRAGTVLGREHLAFRKPGTGMPPEQLPRVIGRTLRRPIQANELLQDSDFEEAAALQEALAGGAHAGGGQ